MGKACSGAWTQAWDAEGLGNVRLHAEHGAQGLQVTGVA